MSRGLDGARKAFEGRLWADAFHAYGSLTKGEGMSAEDWERLAISGFLTGEDESCVNAFERSYRMHLDAGQSAEAARLGFWLAFSFMMGGKHAQAGAWLGRTEAILADEGDEIPAAGYVLIPKLLQSLGSDPQSAAALGSRATELGDRLGDADLRAFGILGHAQALIAMGEIAGGMGRLDEVMVSVTGGEVGPITSGVVYCAVILECMSVLDLRRAAEWTEALSDWCDAQQGLVPYQGQCLVHRSQIRQAAGDWSEAERFAEAARERLSDPQHPALGLAHYQEGELHRLRGDFKRAVDAYGMAARFGFDPMPGLALLDLARGDRAAAIAGIGRALESSAENPTRTSLLAAAIDIARAAGDVRMAREHAEEIAALADGGASDVQKALAQRAIGSVLLLEGKTQAALEKLRSAQHAWQQIPMPYEAAVTAVLIGLGCATLGDSTTAGLEFANAKTVFEELGAAPDLHRLSDLTAGPAIVPTADHPLSKRELEILGHVAAGETNREIAESLVISQHTVSRHLENIFAKIGVSSRAAATAYAYEHDLI